VISDKYDYGDGVIIEVMITTHCMILIGLSLKFVGCEKGGGNEVEGGEEKMMVKAVRMWWLRVYS